MSLYKRRNTVFDRIGDCYGSFIDPNHFLGRSAFDDGWMTCSPINVHHGENQFDLKIALPGCAKEDITVSVNEDELEITAKGSSNVEKNALLEEAPKEVNQKEFRKTFQLSSLIDTNKIVSTYDNGILKVRLPKHNRNGSSKIIKVA